MAEVEEAIRPGGLAPTKAVRIEQILARSLGDDEPWRRRLAWLADAPLSEARDYLLRRCRAWAARRRPACCSSPSAATTCRWTPTSTGWAPGSGCSAPGAAREAHDELLRLSTPEGRLRDAHAADPPRPAHLRGAHARAARECPLRRMCPEGRRRWAAA